MKSFLYIPGKLVIAGTDKPVLPFPLFIENRLLFSLVFLVAVPDITIYINVRARTLFV